MKKRSILSLLVVAFCVMAKAEVVEISTAEQLAALASSWNSSNTYELTADIDLTDYSNWTPIGTATTPFTSTFDGKGHRITNMTVNAEATETGYVAGLFGVVGAGGMVKDLTVVTTEVRIDKTNIVNGEPVVVGENVACFVGSIAGINLGTIIGCANRGVTVYGNWNGARVGGIAGDNSGSIENCYNLGEVYTGSYTDNILGGIAGQNSAGGTIKNCFVRATIDKAGTATHGPIYGNNLGSVSGCFYMNGTSSDGIASLVLGNSADNSSAISDANGTIKNVLLDSRTIYSDEAWNTLCLPFDIPASGNGRSPIAGASVKELNLTSSGFNIATGVLTLNFIDATSIEAGKPYLVKWDEAITENLSNPVFMGVTVNDASPATNIKTNDNNVQFLGFYSQQSIASEDPTILYLGAENKLYYPSTAMNIGACRAYFKLLDGSATVKKSILNFDNEATGTTVINAPMSPVNSASPWYEVSGRKLNSKPHRKGIYIINNKTVVIQ